MFGWKKDRDFQGRIDMEANPWDLGDEPVPPRPHDPRVDPRVDTTPRVDMTLNGPRTLPGGVPRRLAEAPAPPPRRADLRPAEDEGKRLIVGRDIVLTGEIKACDRLVVEGRVEAALSDIRTVEVTQTGLLKGAAQVDTADIAGSYEGDLTVQQKLLIRATGRVHGRIRYGSIEVERGGRIGGEVESLAAPAADAASPPERPESTSRLHVDVDETEDTE